MNPAFKPTRDGFTVVDPIERQHYRIGTDRPVAPTAVPTDRLSVPLGSAVEITVERLRLPDGITVYVREPDVSLVTQVQPGTETTLENDAYLLDVSDPMKVYVAAESEIRIGVETETVVISFGEPTAVTVGARSYHSRPAATITTTTDPTDVMAAVSQFGSALKTTTARRSYPTHRGHPPALELGDELAVPDGISPPETGVRIEVPPTLESIFPVAPLAYYLGATVVPGSMPRLATTSGYTYPLEGPTGSGIEATVERVLKQVFLLDCLVRTGGAEPGPLYERRVLEPDLPFDIERVYGQPSADRLEAYLEVPSAVVEPQFPESWLETRVPATPRHAEFLPFLANDLAAIRLTDRASGSATARSTIRPNGVAATDERPASSMQSESGTVDTVDTVGRDAMAEVDSESNANANTKQNPNPNAASSPRSRSPVALPTVEQRWDNGAGIEIPSTIPLSALRNEIAQSPRDGPLKLEVVCNDPKMSEELVAVRDAYRIGERDDGDDEFALEVTLHHDLTADELATVLARESDFVHYIGHIDTDGFRCADGSLDATTLETVGTKAFFLNACHSAEQGLGLIEAGSLGGIVTLEDVSNGDAVGIGRRIARLLNRGFPLYAALALLSRTQRDHQYHILGDGTTTVAQTRVGSVLSGVISRSGGTGGDDRDGDRGGYEITLSYYVTASLPKGGICLPYIEPIDTYYLVPGNVDSIPVSTPDLVDVLHRVTFPVFFEGEFRWSSEISVGELTE